MYDAIADPGARARIIQPAAALQKLFVARAKEQARPTSSRAAGARRALLIEEPSRRREVTRRASSGCSAGSRSAGVNTWCRRAPHDFRFSRGASRSKAQDDPFETNEKNPTAFEAGLRIQQQGRPLRPRPVRGDRHEGHQTLLVDLAPSQQRYLISWTAARIDHSMCDAIAAVPAYEPARTSLNRDGFRNCSSHPR